MDQGLLADTLVPPRSGRPESSGHRASGAETLQRWAHCGRSGRSVPGQGFRPARAPVVRSFHRLATAAARWGSSTRRTSR